MDRGIDRGDVIVHSEELERSGELGPLSTVAPRDERFDQTTQQRNKFVNYFYELHAGQLFVEVSSRTGEWSPFVCRVPPETATLSARVNSHLATTRTLSQSVPPPAHFCVCSFFLVILPCWRHCRITVSTDVYYGKTVWCVLKPKDYTPNIFVCTFKRLE